MSSIFAGGEKKKQADDMESWKFGRSGTNKTKSCSLLLFYTTEEVLVEQLLNIGLFSTCPLPYVIIR